MFRRNKKDRIPFDRPYTREAARYLKRPENGAEQPGGSGNGIDRYMYENIMTTLRKNYGSDILQTDADAADSNLMGDSGNGDSIGLQVNLPLDKARQLQVLAREFDEDPHTLARMWIIERLKELWMSYTPSSPTTAERPGLPRSPSNSGEPAPPADESEEELTALEQAKVSLAEKYIADPEEKALFLQTFLFKQWGNYIAGLVLANKGNTAFTVEDIKSVLRYDLLPEYYNTPGAEESALLTADVEVEAPGDAPRGFASLKRIAPSVFKFIGFKKARIVRAGR